MPCTSQIQISSERRRHFVCARSPFDSSESSRPRPALIVGRRQEVGKRGSSRILGRLAPRKWGVRITFSDNSMIGHGIEVLDSCPVNWTGLLNFWLVSLYKRLCCQNCSINRSKQKSPLIRPISGGQNLGPINRAALYFDIRCRGLRLYIDNGRVTIQ